MIKLNKFEMAIFTIAVIIYVVGGSIFLSNILSKFKIEGTLNSILTYGFALYTLYLLLKASGDEF